MGKKIEFDEEELNNILQILEKCVKITERIEKRYERMEKNL